MNTPPRVKSKSPFQMTNAIKSRSVLCVRAPPRHHEPCLTCSRAQQFQRDLKNRIRACKVALDTLLDENEDAPELEKLNREEFLIDEEFKCVSAGIRQCAFQGLTPWWYLCVLLGCCC